MTRYRQTMADAYGTVVENTATAMQVQNLKKAYADMKGKRISLDNAKKLQQIFNRFDSNKELLKQLYKADIPFVSEMSSARLISKHAHTAQMLMQIRKEGIEVSLKELKQMNEGPWPLDEGKMSQIDQMQKDGASAEEIAKKLKVKVSIVKGILGEDSNKTYKVEKDGKVVFTGKYNDVLLYRKKHGGEIITEETLVEFTQKQIKMAFGILNDPRYKGGNYSGAHKAIEKLAKGLASHPSVANALKRANESIEEAVKKEGGPPTDGGPGSGAHNHDGAGSGDSKSTPKARPKLDKAAIKKDLEDVVTDGSINIDHNADGSIDMSKEYEPSQDYDIDQDAKAIKKALMSKGIAEKDIDIDKEEDEEYLQLSVSVRKEEVNESLEEKIQPGFAVRYLDPKNGKRLVAAYKTKKDADDKAAQLKKDGAKDITITKHDLNFKEAMPGGANSSSRRGSASTGKKKKYRFGYRVAEKQPTGDKLAEEPKDVATGKRISFEQLTKSLKDFWTEAADDKEGASTAKVPPVSKDNKPGVKIAKIRLKRDKMDGEGNGDGDKLAKKEDEVNILKQKIETEKQKSSEKATKKLINPETGEPLLQIGIAYKHIRDKLNKEKEKKKEEVKESEDYLRSKLSSSQIANIKATWKNKKATDVTASVKDMIKKMDIPTQLAIKAADIPHISKLVEGKYTRYSDLLIQKGRMQKAGDKQGEKQTDKEIEKEKQKLGIKENFTVQVIKTDGGKFVHGSYKTEKEAQKWIDWYKTGNLSKMKAIKIIPEEINEQRETFVNILNETDKDSAYAIGMSVAKKKMNDEPPLEKKTIKKAHDIADKIMAKEVHPSRDTYERLIKGN